MSSHLLQVDVQLLGKVYDTLFAVELPVQNLFDAHVGDGLEAIETRGCGCVDGRIVDAHTELGCMDDCVDLGVNGAGTMVVFNLAPNLGAMGQPMDGTVVPSGEDCTSASDDRTNVFTVAGCPGRDLVCYVHEVFVP